MGSGLCKCLHRLRSNTPQKWRVRLHKICQQLKESNPKRATKPGQYYRSYYLRSRERYILFWLPARYSDTNNHQLHRWQSCIYELHSTSSRIWGTLQRKISYECRGTRQLVSIRKYNRDLTTGAVSAHQHLCIDKLLKKLGMELCNLLPTPFPQKADHIVKEFAEPVAIHDENLV